MNLDKDQTFAYVFLILTTTFWAANAVAGKLAVGHLSPMLLTTIRWIMALTILLFIGGKQAWSERAIVLPHLPLLIALGATGFTLFNVSLYSALNFTSAINVTIEQASIPMIIFIANFLLYRTQVTRGQMAGFVLTLIGILIVASNGSLQNLLALKFNRGDILMFAGCVFYATYSVALRYKPDIHWKTMMVVMAASAMVVSLPFTLNEIATDRVIWPDARGWMIAVFTAVFPSVLSQTFFIRGVQLIGPNRAGLFINLVPVMATIFAILILGEAFGVHHALALALVFGGIYLAERKKRPSRLQQAL